MANISITTTCNRHCQYCFGGAIASRNVMRREDFSGVLDLLERSGVRQVRLLGGEPTLHPDFPELLAESVGRGFTVLVFSNGLMPPRSLKALAALPAESCSVLLNVPCPPDATDAQTRRLAQVCRALGARAGAGVNIFRTGLTLGRHLDLIDRFGLNRTLRLGLAHPRAGAGNTFLDPKFYHAVGRELLGLARLAQARQVRLTFDCGFVPCMFPPEFLQLAGVPADEVGTRCNPMPDILPDLSAIHCYGLGGLERYPICGIETLSELRLLHERRMADVRRLGVFRQCSDCSVRRAGRCVGGCLAAAIRRLNGGPGADTASATGAGQEKRPSSAAEARPARRPQQPSHCWMLPYIDQRGEFWADLSARHPGMIGGVYFPLSVPGIGSGRPAQPARYLAEFLKQEAVGKSALVNAPVLPPPARASRSTILDALCRLAEEYGLAGATLCDIILAEMVRKRLPELELTASTLMEIAEPNQAVMLEGLFHVLVPATRVLRSPAKLEEIRAAFPGRIRLLVNEGCLPGCPYRRQHFHEMAYATDAPESLCQGLLDRRPWLRLTGAWVLPQHLHWYDGLADQYKLAGRVTLQRPEDYLRVCGAYIARTALWPHQIGAGPASVLGRLAVTDEFFEKLMACRMQCHECDLCSRVAQGMESQ